MRTRSVGLTVLACAVALAATAEAQEHRPWSGQVGAAIMLTPRAALNVDAKDVKIHTDVRSGGATVYHVAVNPFVPGVGVGYRL
jgi:outer membrane protein W